MEGPGRRGLEEPEDENDEKDSSTDAGGGGREGVCEGGDGGGGEESMVEPEREEGTETMEDNRDMKMGISGEGVRVCGERERTEETGKKRRTRRIQTSREM